MDDGKPILANAPREALAEALKPEVVGPVPEAAGKPPLGHVERHLTMQDRNMIVGAALALCQHKDHKKLKDQRRLEAVKRLLKFDETLDYFAMVNDSLEEEQARWEGARERYRLFRKWKEGGLKTEDFRKDYPGIDLGEGPPKPPLRGPEMSPQDKRGPERPFFLPAKLDAWIEEALREMDWDTPMSEGSVELAEKYGIGKEEAQ
jgi:hypothetical protein